jgi:poly-gamma-glutamate synthesis protein (capsule biosynthesis protein)
VARIASGWVDGGAILDRASSAIRFGTAGRPAVAQTQLAKDEVRRISPGWWLAPAPGGGEQVRAGTDLLFGTGSFEQTTVGETDGRAPLWSQGKYADLTPDASCQPTGRGVLLVRTPLSAEEAVMAPDHRASVVPGQKLSLVANVRQASEGSRLEVHWYEDMVGSSSSTSRLELPSGAWSPGSCQRVRFDRTVPAKAVAAQVFIVLEAPEGGQTIRRLAIDDLSLVDWAPKGRSGRRYDMVDGLRSGSVTFHSDSAHPADPKPVVP